MLSASSKSTTRILLKVSAPFWIAIIVLIASAVDAMAQNLYSVTISGTVLQRPFQRVGNVAVCPTITRFGTQNGVNPFDVALISGNPAGRPETGAIWFSTNTSILGGRARLDMANVSYNATSRIVNVFPDSRIAATGLNLFTASSGLTATPFTIRTGQMALQFDQSFNQINGFVDLVGVGFTFSSQNRYAARISGRYVGRITCPVPDR